MRSVCRCPLPLRLRRATSGWRWRPWRRLAAAPASSRRLPPPSRGAPARALGPAAFPKPPVGLSPWRLTSAAVCGTLARRKRDLRWLTCVVRSCPAATPCVARSLPKLAMEAESLRSKAADLQSQLASLEAAAKAAAEDDSRLKVVEKELAAAEKALAEVRAGAAGLQGKAAKLQKQMEEAGGAQLKAARAAVAKLQEEIDSFTTGAAQKRATIAANQKQAAKLEKTLADSEKASAIAGRRRATRQAPGLSR